jgi:hypothetical protein
MSRKTPAPEKRRLETLTAAVVALTALLQAVFKFIEVIHQHGR